jgi:hypothetical protein
VHGDEPTLASGRDLAVRRMASIPVVAGIVMSDKRQANTRQDHYNQTTQCHKPVADSRAAQDTRSTAD